MENPKIKEEKERGNHMLKSTIGYSTNADSFTSGKETATKAMDGYKAPKLGIISCSWVYQEEEVLKGVQSITGTLPLIGCTSSGAIMVPDGIITGNQGFSGMMIFDDEDMKVAVAGMAKNGDAREMGRQIAIEAIKNAGTKVRPSYFYMVASPAEEEFYLQGIQDVIGRVPMFGGSCADDNLDGEGRILCNGEAFADGCAVAFFYTDKKIVTEYTGAYRETADRGIITKVANKRTLMEIDGVPALQKYADWTGTTVDKLQGMDLLSATITSPLGIKDPVGNITVIRHPMAGNADNSMNIGNFLEEGTAIVRMEATVDELIESNRTVLENTKESLNVKPAAYFLVHCGGRKLGIGDRMEEVYNQVKSVANDTPFMMIFTFGEYGYANHSANTCGGLMLSFTGFAE